MPDFLDLLCRALPVEHEYVFGKLIELRQPDVFQTRLLAVNDYSID